MTQQSPAKRCTFGEGVGTSHTLVMFLRLLNAASGTSMAGLPGGPRRVTDPRVTASGTRPSASPLGEQRRKERSGKWVDEWRKGKAAVYEDVKRWQVGGNREDSRGEQPACCVQRSPHCDTKPECCQVKSGSYGTAGWYPLNGNRALTFVSVPAPHARMHKRSMGRSAPASTPRVLHHSPSAAACGGDDEPAACCCCLTRGSICCQGSQGKRSHPRRPPARPCIGHWEN